MKLEIKKPQIKMNGKKKKAMKDIDIDTKSINKMVKNLEDAGKKGKPKIANVELKKNKLGNMEIKKRKIKYDI